jgi:bisanhydrobacterioruberin hydratase
MLQRNAYIYLTAIAIIFHVVGLVGIGFLHSPLIERTTPFHLLLMFILLLLSYRVQWMRYARWWLPAFIIGFVAEWIGVHTGWLFGSYSYTAILGVQLAAIPLLIGCNWVVVLTGAISIALLLKTNKWITAVVAATVATAYDWVLEPMAIQLGYWHWHNGEIPLYNYASWWLVSYLLAVLWQYAAIRANKFGITLFIIQLLFFIILRILL